MVLEEEEERQEDWKDHGEKWEDSGSYISYDWYCDLCDFYGYVDNDDRWYMKWDKRQELEEQTITKLFPGVDKGGRDERMMMQNAKRRKRNLINIIKEKKWERMIAKEKKERRKYGRLFNKRRRKDEQRKIKEGNAHKYYLKRKKWTDMKGCESEEESERESGRQSEN
jgi:hypothetical protein